MLQRSPTCQEEFAFQNQMLEQQLNETRIRKTIEIEEVIYVKHHTLSMLQEHSVQSVQGS
jgi:hypothetical protein